MHTELAGVCQETAEQNTSNRRCLSVSTHLRNYLRSLLGTEIPGPSSLEICRSNKHSGRHVVPMF